LLKLLKRKCKTQFIIFVVNSHKTGISTRTLKCHISELINYVSTVMNKLIKIFCCLKRYYTQTTAIYIVNKF